MCLGSFDEAVSLVRKLGQGGQPVTIAVDGHSAAGKSTFARNLQTTLSNVQLVYGDDFYRVIPETERFNLNASEGYRRYYDWERLERQVLSPLAARQEARYGVYNWATGALGDTKASQPRGIIVVEGIFSARPELRSYYSAIFLVSTRAEIRARRQQQRGDASAAWLGRWDAAEKFYLETHKPHTYADLVILTA